MAGSYFIGIDIGTQGARVILIDANGNVIGNKEENFLFTEESREEQSPEAWWETCRHLLSALINETKKNIDLKKIKAIAVTSTSGTVIPLDKNNRAIHNAIMYSDPRSAQAADLCKSMALNFNSDGYTGFNASSGLSKMVWFVQTFPDKVQKISKWIHAADYINGKLSNRWHITDYTNALKSGYDVKKKEWPRWLYEKLPLKKEWLPDVIQSGAPVGNIFPAIAAEFGLMENVQIVTGITDGCASQIAAGAVNPGDWNTTIGTTLVIKGVTKKEINDPLGRLYNHRHPQGYWMPGGASNIGADWVTKEFGENIKKLNEEAAKLIPTNYLSYPLLRHGERFPFIAPQAKGFAPAGLSQAWRFAANMEGVAYIERYAFEMIENLSGEKVKTVFTAGGGSNSNTWLTIRSSVLNLPIYKMKYVTGAMGAAILAASQTHFKSLTVAAKVLTQIEKEILPEKKLAEQYNTNYHRFIVALQEKGYISKKEKHA